MKLRGSLRLGGGIAPEKTYHGHTEYAQWATELVENYAEEGDGKAMRWASLGARGVVLCLDISARTNSKDN